MFEEKNPGAISVPSVSPFSFVYVDPINNKIVYASSYYIYSCDKNGENNQIIFKLDDYIGSIVELEEGIYIFSIYLSSKTLYIFNAKEKKLQKKYMENIIISKLCKHPNRYRKVYKTV